MSLNIGQIFPISDAPSARLMKLKALCLFRAGIVTEPQRKAITRRANEVLAYGQVPPRGRSYDSKAA
jgi:hypothetical protein